MKREHKVDGMPLATFLTTVFYSATYPYIHREIMQTVNSSMVAVQQIIDCLGVVVVGWLWNRKSDALFRFYPAYCIAETCSGVALTVYAIITGNIVAYYIVDTVLFAIITRNIICGGTKMRAIRYATEKERERFDNNDKSAAAVATIIGSLIAMRLNLSFNIMLCIATFGNAIDNSFYIGIYYAVQRNRRR